MVVLLAACAGGSGEPSSRGSGDPVTPDPAPVSSTVTRASEAPAPETTAPDTTTSISPERPTSTLSGCTPIAGGTEFESQATVELALIGEDNGLQIYAAEYPLPGPTAGLWSQWGQGAFASNGLHYSGVGDHEGVDGNSYMFEYDPETRSLSRVFDVLSLVDHEPGTWGYGKLHSQIVEDGCGHLWAATYWGNRPNLDKGDEYDGDLLLEMDPAGGVVATYGPIAEQRGGPSLISVPDGRYLVVEALHPTDDDGDLVVFDSVERRVAHAVDVPGHIGFRALAVDDQDRVTFSVLGGEAMALDPASGQTAPAGYDWPAEEDDDFLRAATPLTPDGVFYGVMADERRLFSVDSDGDVTDVAETGGYTASLAMTPDGSRVFWLPRAHGGAWKDGADVRMLETESGEVSDLVSLQDAFEQELGLRVGGTYSIVYGDGRLVLGVNASELEDDSGFGTVVLVVVEGL